MKAEILGIIPARFGSKGVPRKNVRLVAGKPLIAWTWEAARKAPSIDRLIVSTDDPEVMELARSADIEVPFKRPEEFASDTASAVDVVVHALEWLKKSEGYEPDLLLWLQPTSPLRMADDIEAAITLQREKSADSVISVCPAEHHPLWMKCVREDGLLTAWTDATSSPQRRQELPQAFRLNGAIYVIRRDVLLKERSFYAAATYAHIMPNERSLDIDTPWELFVADLILKHSASQQ
jgi:CMP-N,N'-diacetyllegionaminic acid synthase